MNGDEGDPLARLTAEIGQLRRQLTELPETLRQGMLADLESWAKVNGEMSHEAPFTTCRPLMPASHGVGHAPGAKDLQTNPTPIPGILPQEGNCALNTDPVVPGVCQSPKTEGAKDKQEAQPARSRAAPKRRTVGNQITWAECSGESLVEPASFKRLQRCLLRLVESSSFDYVSGAVVCLNALTIGMQTDTLACSLDELPPAAYRIADSIFCTLFTLELICRLGAYGRSFWQSKWNLFDSALVSLQLTDEIMSHAASGLSASGFNFSFMRVLRILRLIRILRIIRILRLIAELRAIVSSIVGSMRSLGWTVVLLFLVMYVFGVYLTQVVLDYRVALASTSGTHLTTDDPLVRYFGSLPQSIQSLYQAITSGLEWGALSDPLINHISVWYGLVMALFIAFAVLALMNVVTGVFVEAALKNAKSDHDEYMIRHVRELFMEADCTRTGHVGWDQFQAQAENKHMQEFFKSIDVDASEAEAVFKLLDVDDSGSIDLEEFLNGCLNLKGPARALDTSALMRETRVLSRTCEAILRDTRALASLVVASAEHDGMLS